VHQFIGESLLVSFVALIFALGLVIFFLPVLNFSFSLALYWKEIFVPTFFPPLLLIVGLIGFLSGIYPAVYLSSFSPLIVIKGELTRGKKGGRLRRAMIVFQFVVSITLITGMITMNRQVSFMKNKDLGFSGENVMTFAAPRSSIFLQNIAAVREALLQHPDILEVSISHGYPGRPSNNEGLKVGEESVGFTHYSVDSSFIDVYRLQLLQGRFIDSQRSSDRIRAVVLNETAVREFGLEDPVGMILPHEINGLTAFPVDEIEVIGVIKDFHCRPLHREINPVIISYNEEWISRGNILTSGKNLQDVVGYIQDLWRKFAPGFPFEYVMVDEDFKNMYSKDAGYEKIFSYAAAFSILVACLGLFGLSSYIAEIRTKEIGIRKVLGAPLGKILVLFSKEFAVAVVLANLVAWPIGYYFMNKWLASFAYRIDMGVLIFVVAGLVAFLIAMLTVGFHSLKAAAANPIDALRYE